MSRVSGWRGYTAFQAWYSPLRVDKQSYPERPGGMLRDTDNTAQPEPPGTWPPSRGLLWENELGDATIEHQLCAKPFVKRCHVCLKVGLILLLPPLCGRKLRLNEV